MCGIIGIISNSDVAERLVDGLKRLEYRGYDSAGVATIHDGAIERRRAEGKLANLVTELRDEPLPGTTGIAHTRWATHGAPTTSNAHPHATREVALVHNGIIENFKPLRAELMARGRIFDSQTDTEVVAHLVSELVEQGASPKEAVAQVLPRLHGAFALAILFRSHPDMLIGARLGSPLVVGYGDGETYLGSDALALAPLTQKIAYLEEGDWVVITKNGAEIFDKDDVPVERAVTVSGVSGAMIDKGNHRHFMQKEIYEQPLVGGQSSDHPALGMDAEDRPDFLAARFGNDRFLLQRIGIAKQHPGLALKKRDLRVGKQILQHDKAVAVEGVGLFAADGRVRVPGAMDDGIETRQKFRHGRMAGWVEVFHGTPPLFVHGKFEMAGSGPAGAASVRFDRVRGSAIARPYSASAGSRATLASAG